MLKIFFNIPIGLAVAASLPMLSSLILVLYPIEAASAAPRKSSGDNNQNNVQNKYELKTNKVTNNKFGTQTSDAPRGGFSTGIMDPRMDGRTDGRTAHCE